MKLFGCTMVKNEEDMIPYVMPYVENLDYDKFVVYDDGSTDNTIEKLKKYPFVEIRQCGEGETFDDRKCQVQADFFSECWKYIQEHNNEEVWMTFTDFDEVIFPYKMPYGFKTFLTFCADQYGCNYFDGQIINLIPPKGYENVSLKTKLNPDEFVHTLDGIRAGIWASQECFKPVLIKVNDFQKIETFYGNHRLWAESCEGCIAKNLSEHNDGTIVTFHLKYIDKNALYNKEIRQKRANCEGGFEKRYNNIIVGTSFPLELYFAYKCLTYKKEPWAGLFQ